MWQVVESKMATLNQVKEEWFYSDLLKFAYRSHVSFINNEITRENQEDGNR